MNRGRKIYVQGEENICKYLQKHKLYTGLALAQNLAVEKGRYNLYRQKPRNDLVSSSCRKRRNSLILIEQTQLPGSLIGSQWVCNNDRASLKTVNADASTTSLSSTRGELRINDRVIVSSSQGSKTGILRYQGPTEFAAGEWCGVELDEPIGKNDGSVNDKRCASPLVESRQRLDARKNIKPAIISII